jgi:hypothetical protein
MVYRTRHPALRFSQYLRRGPNLLALAVLAGLIGFQAYAYFYKLTLSLGPRVIMQPWAMQNGAVIYENLADLHTPLMPLIISLLRYLIPEGLRLAKLTQVGLLSLSTLLIFVAGKRKSGWWGGLWAAGFFVVWSPAMNFGKLWHESFLAPLYVLLWLLYEPAATRRSGLAALLGGLLGGVAVLIKQHAAVLLLAYLVWLAYGLKRQQYPARDIWRQIGRFVLAGSIPLILFTIYQYLQAGTLNGFLYWVIGYSLNSNYIPQTAQPPTINNIKGLASSWLLVPATILCAWDARKRQDESWLESGLALLMLFTSMVTIYPRFTTFHLQASLPILAIVGTLALAYALRQGNTQRTFAIGISLALSAYWLLTAGWAYRPAFSPQPNRYIYEYSDLVPLARAVKQQIGTGTCFYIFPDDEATSNLYYLSGCMPPRFWIFDYPWYMLDWVKASILSNLETSQPEWVIYFPGRWQVEINARGVNNYIQAHYQKQAPLPWAQGEAWLMKKIK